MKSTRSELIDNSEVELSIRLFQNVNCIETITTEASAFEDFIIKFRLPIDDYSKLEDEMRKKDITFFDWVGVGKEYKQVFDEFKLCTNFTKKEVSNKLRHATVCNQVYPEQIEFMVIIAEKSLVEDNQHLF